MLREGEGVRGMSGGGVARLPGSSHYFIFFSCHCWPACSPPITGLRGKSHFIVDQTVYFLSRQSEFLLELRLNIFAACQVGLCPPIKAIHLTDQQEEEDSTLFITAALHLSYPTAL